MKHIYSSGALIALMLVVLMSATPAHAALPKVGGSGRGEGSMNLDLGGTDEQIRARAEKAIDARIEDLGKLKTRLSEMKRLSDSVESALVTMINSEITALTTLKTKLATETGATLKADAKTITSGFRVYMMVMPQIRLLSAADRAQKTADMLATLLGKLQVRVTKAQTEGKDVAALNASLADMNTKIAEAKAAATQAVTLLTDLTPDQKDKAKMEANQKVVADARAKIKTAETALKAARDDAHDVVQTLKGERKESEDKKEKDSR